MAAPKRTKLQREAQLPEIERLHNLGHSTRHIGALLSLSHSVIQRDLETVTQRYHETALVERVVQVIRQIAALREVRREAWEAWERSKEDSVKRIEKKAGGEIRLTIITESQLPDNEYLLTVLRTLQEEAKLLGLYAPKESTPPAPDAKPSYVSLSAAERDAALARLDTRVDAASGDAAARSQALDFRRSTTNGRVEAASGDAAPLDSLESCTTNTCTRTTHAHQTR